MTIFAIVMFMVSGIVVIAAGGLFWLEMQTIKYQDQREEL